MQLNKRNTLVIKTLEGKEVSRYDSLLTEDAPLIIEVMSGDKRDKRILKLTKKYNLVLT